MSESELEISTNPDRIDVAAVHEYLSTSYWAQGRSRATVDRSIRNSLCFGAYLSDRQVGFGRVVTDFAVFAYVADVFVVPEYRGHGIGKAIVRTIVEAPELQGLQLMMLRTRDAHGLYRPFGFDALPHPEEMMTRYASQ